MDTWSIDNTTLEAKYDEGYRAGSQDTVEQIFEELEKTLESKHTAVSHIAERTFDGQTACLATGMADAYQDIKITLEELKKKYGVK